MNEATTYDIVIRIFGFAFACFSLGYALGKDIGTKKMTAHASQTVRSF